MNNETTPPPPAGSGEKSQETKRPSVVVKEEQKKVVVTEGQLKWAQFHSKRRAQSVRGKVEELWQTPPSLADVDGAQSDDGNTTEESFSIEEEDEASRKLLRKKLEEARRKKPSVSRGRRALLRVSKRAFTKRRQDIQKFGFRCSDGDMEDDDNHDDALAAKFADETAWKKARRNRRRRKAKSTQERLRRFENAFRAMMMSIAAASEPQNPEIAVPTKVWSRPEDAKRFVSVDGRQYRDLKWGETGSGSRERVAQMLTTTDFASMPIDPRASWLVHIPSKQQDKTAVGSQAFPTNADGDLLIPENINGGGDKMIPVPMGSEKFNEIVGTLQSQAQLSQQQKDQLELMMKSRSHDFKWQVESRSQAALNQGYDDEDGYEDDLEDDDADDEEEALNPEHLKTIAAEYLTEFVANTDEKQVIAALGEQYRDEVGSLVEAASDHGQPTCPSTSKDIVRRYLQGMNSATGSSASEKPQGSEEHETQEHQSQMASFAGIAAMYLAELSRPRKIKKTLVSCRQEQGLLVKELKSILGELYTNGSFSGTYDDAQNAGSLYESNKLNIESIIAKFTLAKLPAGGYIESDVVGELRQREGREFLKLLVQYLEKVKQAAKKQEAVRSEQKSSRRGSVASRYMETLGKLPVAGPEPNQDEPTEFVTEEQILVERIAVEFLSGALCNEQDVVSVIRNTKQSTIPMVVTKYLQALSDSIAIGKETRIQLDDIQSTTSVDHFDCSRSIFAALDDQTPAERANQRTFEAITSRYLSSITQISEDTIFMELGREERQGFSRIITTHLDEIMVLQQQLKPTRRMGTPATSYLQSLDFDSSLPEDSMYGLNHQDVEGIVAQYIDQISGSSHKISFSAPSKQQEGTKFSWLVASYLGALCDRLHQDADDKGTIQQTGAVSNYLESLGASMPNSTSDLDDETACDNYFESDFTFSNGATLNSTETSRQATGGAAAGLSTKFSNGTTAKSTESTRSSITPPPPAGTRRSPQASGGVAAKYLTAVIDAEEDDDIFAELRKQDSPKFSENTQQATAFAAQHHQESQDMHPAQHKGGFGEVHVQSAPIVLSPLSQATGLPQVLQTEIVLDRKAAASYLSRLRPDCNDHDIQVAIGSIGSSDQARAQFARGVTELLMGVRANTNPKRSRAAASRYLAAMRGLQVVPEPEAYYNFESALIQDAGEMLAECSCQGDPPQLSQALKKLGKEDGELFAGFIAGYLNGSILPAGTCEEQNCNELPGELPFDGKQSHQSPGTNSQTESDFFAGMRQKTVDVNLPTLAQRTEAKRLSYLYGSRRTTPKNTNFSAQHQGDSLPLSSTETNEDVLKNSTFNSIENRRASYRNDVEEEKKTSGPGSPTFDGAELALAQGDAENIPFDPQDPPSGHTYSGNPQPVASPSRSHGSNSEFTPERLRDFHQSVMDKSALIGEGNAEQTIIDTDGTTSEASDTEMSPRRLAGLMLSPTILTKRHKQAVRAIENKKWDQVSYLLNANPWLAEMPEIRTSQYLLHKIAFYGASAPSELCTEVVKMYPAAEKFDKKGMLPLHSASEAGNLTMISLLGDRFPSGASVRDEEGMLPIHLAMASHGKRRGTKASLLEVVKSVLSFFPGALAVADNSGNLPLHIAAECLGGDDGSEVINFLLDEAQKQLKRDDGVRFHNKPRMDDSESATGTTASGATNEVNSDYEYDDQLQPSMVENNMGNIPLWLALAKSAPSGIIESLVVGPGGRQSALKQDTNGNTALHRLLLQDRPQMTALKSLLKIAPESASVVNVEHMLPIEMACLKGVALEMVLEILLVDLPFVLSDGIKPRGGGASLWFLACECHDRYLGVLEKLISMCSYQQVHELAFASRDGSRSTLISSASPECGEFLTVSLLFVGRFEFLQYDPKSISGEVKLFDALDYGTADAPYEEGRRVSLKCFTSEQQYEEEISSLRSMELDFDYVAQVSCFVVGERDSYRSGGRQQFCVSIEQPSLTLDRVMAGMLKNDACRENTGLRRKYVNKILSVLRIVAKALHRLHSFGVIHGNLVPEACGKCDGAAWKLLGTLQFQSMGAKFDANVFGAAAPPEALEPHHSALAVDRQAAFRTNLAVDPSIDAWGFGKLSYEVLVGESLVEFDTSSKEVHHDHRSLLKILHWSTIDLVDVRRRLRQAGVPDSAVHVITKCLSPDPSSRPSMSEVLRRGPWEDGQQRPPQQLSQAPPDLHEC